MSLLIAFGLAAFLQSAAAPTTATVAGRVVEAGTAAPIAGAQVTVMLIPGDRRSPMFGGLRPYTATTDGDGQYQIAGLQPGRYQVRAQKTGYAMPLDSFMPPIDIAPGPNQGIDVPLQRAAVIVGRVLDESGEPLADVRVLAMTRPPKVQGAPAAQLLRQGGAGVQTNDLGEFRLFNLPPGEYFIQALPHLDDRQAAGAGRTLLPTFYPDATSRDGAASIVLASGQTSDPIDIRMAGAPAFGVSGVVVDVEGKPVANAMVKLLSDEPDATSAAIMMAPWKQGRTDQSGRFTITNVTRGSYKLLAIAPRLIAGPDPRAVAGRGGGSFMSFESGVSGTVSGVAAGVRAGAVMTETSNGATVEFRDDAGTSVALTIDAASISNLKVTVRIPAAPQQ